MTRSILFSASVLLSLAACGGSSPVAPVPVAPSPSPTPAATARYRVTFDATWSAQTHPTDIPGNAHFSGLIGGTHRSTVTFWSEGGLASEGIQLMAERGRQTPLDLEVGAAAIAASAIRPCGQRLPRRPAGEHVFDVTRDYHSALVTRCSQPYWFWASRAS